MNFLLNLHAGVLETASPVLHILLKRRLAQGKEDNARLPERRGEAGISRPKGKLIWLHGASVGEAQSTLIIIDHLRQQFPAATILLTTGTVSSARYLESRLPAGVIHQYYPIDRPRWVESFLFHWKPDFVLWMESELWPGMLCALQRQHIPVMLLNARISPRSLKRWQYIPKTARILLQTFSSILTQTEEDARAYRLLGAQNVIVSGNLKYAAADLPVNENDLALLKTAIGKRMVWLYASTHKGEEEIACRIHKRLTADIPDLLTIIVPRHPERRNDIITACQPYDLRTELRTNEKKLPSKDAQIYIADTMGELGLFYRLSPVTCIGRSFSDDGGGGHNPIEAAQLGSAVLHGPHVQNLAEIYRDMDQVGAALCLTDEQDFTFKLRELLVYPDRRKLLVNASYEFIGQQHIVLDRILEHIFPALTSAFQRKRDA